MMDAHTYRDEILVDGAMSDFRAEMTCAGMLRAAQLAAAKHCHVVGYGDQYMASVERVFLLTKVKITIPRAPRRTERVTVETTAYAPDRILYPRTTRFLSMDGEECARVESIWVLVDTATSRIVRKAPESMCFPFHPAPQYTDIKLPERRECAHAQTVRVGYSMVDINRHVNNAVYAELISNALDDRLFAGEAVREMMIGYRREIKPGAHIDLSVAHENERAFVMGTIDGALCFESSVIFDQGQPLTS